MANITRKWSVAFSSARTLCISQDLEFAPRGDGSLFGCLFHFSTQALCSQWDGYIPTNPPYHPRPLLSKIRGPIWALRLPNRLEACPVNTMLLGAVHSDSRKRHSLRKRNLNGVYKIHRQKAQGNLCWLSWKCPILVYNLHPAIFRKTGSVIYNKISHLFGINQAYSFCNAIT